MNNRILAVAAGGGAAGLFAYIAISQRQEAAIASFEATKGYRQPTSEQTRARERSAAIGDMLGELKNKSAREKLEGAFDGAVQTHSIGFPNPATAPSSKETSGPSSSAPSTGGPAIGIG
jgi:hypothetical protein